MIELLHMLFMSPRRFTPLDLDEEGSRPPASLKNEATASSHAKRTQQSNLGSWEAGCTTRMQKKVIDIP